MPAKRKAVKATIPRAAEAYQHPEADPLAVKSVREAKG